MSDKGGKKPERKLKHAAQQLTGKVPAPSPLDELAAKEWARITPELQRVGLLTPLDIIPLAIYCQCVSDIEQQTIALRQLPIGSPEWKRVNAVRTSTHSTLHRMAIHFGFTPHARENVKPDDAIARGNTITGLGDLA